MKKFIVFWMLGAAAAPAWAETTSIAKLMAAGQSVACTFQKVDETGSQDGTLYAAQSRMRTDINVTSVEGTYPMHIVREGDWQYLWGGPMGEKEGMKMSVSAADNAAGRRQGPDFNEDMNFECRPWPVDVSMLTPPSDVQFHDMGLMIPAQAMDPALANGQALQCVACDQVPEGPEREACRQMFGCS